jgi:hypothetical protein
MVAVAALGLLPTSSRNSVPNPGIVFASRLDSAFLRIHSAALPQLRRFGRRADGPRRKADFQGETGGRNGRCPVSTIRATASVSNRERGPHTDFTRVQSRSLRGPMTASSERCVVST